MALSWTVWTGRQSASSCHRATSSSTCPQPDWLSFAGEDTDDLPGVVENAGVAPESESIQMLKREDHAVPSFQELLTEVAEVERFGLLAVEVGEPFAGLAVRLV